MTAILAMFAEFERQIPPRACKHMRGWRRLLNFPGRPVVQEAGPSSIEVSSHTKNAPLERLPSEQRSVGFRDLRCMLATGRRVLENQGWLTIHDSLSERLSAHSLIREDCVKICSVQLTPCDSFGILRVIEMAKLRKYYLTPRLSASFRQLPRS